MPLQKFPVLRRIPNVSLVIQASVDPRPLLSRPRLTTCDFHCVDVQTVPRWPVGALRAGGVLPHVHAVSSLRGAVLCPWLLLDAPTLEQGQTTFPLSMSMCTLY